MTNKTVTISRELAERLALPVTDGEKFLPERFQARAELASILAAPVVERQEPDELFDATMGVIERQAQRIKELEHGQELQEPVVCVIAFREGVKEPEVLSWNQLPVGEHMLYTEQPAPVAVVPDKYDDVLLPFLALMRNELHANAGKGDRPGWLSMTPGECLLEIYYHLGKLQKGVKDGNSMWIKEYSADVANMSMMLADICACLDKVKELNQ